MAEYIERLAIGRAYMDLCLAESKQAKSRKGATFFQGDLLPETEPTTKELFRLVMAMPAADVAPVRHGRWIWDAKGLYPKPLCSRCQYEPYRASNHNHDLPNYCPNCGAKMDGG